ncbi:MAG: hypothetical protein ACI4Q4_09305, partial [Oscillospiraceae bacterium]
MKKPATIFTICGAVLAAAALFLTVGATLLFRVPVLAMIAAAVLSVGCFAAAAGFAEKKKRCVITLSAVAALLTLGIVFGYFCNPYANSISLHAGGFTLDAAEMISKADAEADIKEAYAHLKKVHPLFKNSVPQETKAAYLDALSSVPSEGMTCAELRRCIEKMLSTLGDAHTCVVSYPASERYPIDYGELAKGRGLSITEINGEPLQAFFEAHRDLFSYEAESRALGQLYDNLISDTGLKFLGLGTEVTLTYENETERI